MRWLLITTRDAEGGNPGDGFVRIGIQNLIREVDPSPTFDILDKENPKAYDARPFDRAIICGMPLFWSTTEQTCNQIWWWSRFFRKESWISADHRKLLALGVGHVLVSEPHDIRRYAASINEVVRKTYAVVTREPIIDHPKIIDSVCPSAYAVADSTSNDKKRFCNFMVGSSHFGHLREAQPEVECWHAKVQRISDQMRNAGFKFVAHNNHELILSRHLGWSEAYYFRSAQEYLNLYADAQCYFGNRVHGAAVCAAIGAPSLCVGNDSRIGLVTRLGGLALKPSELEDSMLDRWLSWHDCRGWDVQKERRKMIGLLTSFMLQDI